MWREEETYIERQRQDRDRLTDRHIHFVGTSSVQEANTRHQEEDEGIARTEVTGHGHARSRREQSDVATQAVHTSRARRRRQSASGAVLDRLRVNRTRIPLSQTGSGIHNHSHQRALIYTPTNMQPLKHEDYFRSCALAGFPGMMFSSTMFNSS